MMTEHLQLLAGVLALGGLLWQEIWSRILVFEARCAGHGSTYSGECWVGHRLGRL